MSGSRQRSRHRMPMSSRDSYDESGRDDSQTQEGGPSPASITQLSYTQPPVPQAMMTSGARTVSSDPGAYPSPVSQQPPTDYAATLVSSPASLDPLMARSNEHWADPNLLNMPWDTSEHWPDYGDFGFSQDHFSTYHQHQQGAAWLPPERSNTAPVGAQTSSPPLSPPVPRQSLVGYRPHQHRQPTNINTSFTNFDLASPVPYPVVYDSLRPSGSGQTVTGPPTHRDASESLPSRTVAGLNDLPANEQPPVLPSSVRKALVQAGQRRGQRSGQQVRSRSAAPIGTSRTKIFKVQKGGRSRPLSPTRRIKAEDMRYYGACWRCRKYKKPCTGPGVCETCVACVTSGFRVWPSALGCRRGDLDNFAFSILPTHTEQVLSELHFDYQKPSSWRKAPQIYKSEKLIPSRASEGDKWDQIFLKIQNTRMHGLGIMELLEIAARFQRSQENENKVLANTARSLASICDFYRLVVMTDDPLILTVSAEISNLISQTRKLLIASLGAFLTSCLTGRLRDWLPTFLGTCMIVFGYVTLGDAVIAVPPQYRDKVWYDIQAVVVELRQNLYPTAQDLLSALAKSSKLLNMGCWDLIEVKDNEPSSSRQNSQTPRRERNPEGMRMMDDDVAAFDGLRELQLWHEKYGPLMKDDVWFANAPYTVDILPIAVLERMFDFSPRG